MDRRSLYIIRNLSERYRAMNAKADCLADAAGRVQAVRTDMSYAGRQDGDANYVRLLEKAETARQEADRIMDELRTEAAIMLLRIADIRDPLQQTVLRLRYVDLATWTQVSNETKYSRGHIMRIHRAALRAWDSLPQDDI